MKNSRRDQASVGAEWSYQAFWVSGNGVVGCGHLHGTVLEAAQCGPDGAFVRAVADRVIRSLCDSEFHQLYTRRRKA